MVRKKAFALKCSLLLSIALICIMGAIVPCAYADDIKPDSAILKIDNFTTSNGVDVSKEVATVDLSAQDTSFTLEMRDRYSTMRPNGRLSRTLFTIDKNGVKKEVTTITGNTFSFKTKALGEASKLGVLTRANYDLDKSGNTVSVDYGDRYSCVLNVTFADGQKAENGSNWVIGDGKGFSYTIDNTGFKFVNGTTISLSALHLPVTYKHKSDGTTIVGIGCDANDEKFYQAVKNRNVWQKYSSDEMVKKTKSIDQGYSGRKFGTWGKRDFDWMIFGYAEFNTKKPDEKWSVTLCGKIGVTLEGHAQYLIFTGDLSGSLAAEIMASLIRNPQAQTLTGKLSLGATGRLELYIGLGCQYIASIGVYGAGNIHAGLDLLPKEDFGFNDVYVWGDFGAKAKAFGFTLFTWEILKTPHLDLYKRQRPSTITTQGYAAGGAAPTDGPLAVDANAVYPAVPRDYLDKGFSWNGGADSHAPDAAGKRSDKLVFMAQSAATAQDASDDQENTGGVDAYNLDPLVSNTYSETDVHTASAGNNAIMVFIADANQVQGAGPREDAANRGILVYARYNAETNTWSAPTPVQDNGYADFNPSVCMDAEGNAYVAWLSATQPLQSDMRLGQVADNLVVNVARIDMNGTVTAKSVGAATDNANEAPGMPRICIVGGKPYVAWYTNEAGESAHNGQVIGMSGSHTAHFAHPNGSEIPGEWAIEQTSLGVGAITSFEVGQFGDKPSFAWSIDKDYQWNPETGSSLQESDVFLKAFGEASPTAPTATNASNVQYAKKGAVNVLTFYQEGAIKSVSPASTEPAVELPADGENAIPVDNYLLIGDLGGTAMAAYAVAEEKSTDIHASVLSNGSWSEEAEITDQSKPITFFSPFYVRDPDGGDDPMPVFVFSCDNNDKVAEEGDGSAMLYSLTGGHLQRLAVEDVTFDDSASKPKDELEIDVDVTNSGSMLVESIDVGISLDEGDDFTWSTEELGEALLPGETTTVTITTSLPGQEAFTNTKGLAAQVAVYPTEIRPRDLSRQDGRQFMSFAIGDASLTANATHLLSDGRESVKCTVVNEGIAAESGTLVFENVATGKQLARVDVPKLNAHESFVYTYEAPESLFVRSGIEQIRMTVKGADSEGTEIACQESIVAWTPIVGGVVGERYSVKGNEYRVTSNTKNTAMLVRSKKAKKVSVPAKVTIEGKAYKVTAIGSKAFANAKKRLVTAAIGKYVTSIGKSAFENCKKLKKVKGGKAVTSIGAKAFKGCRALRACAPTASKKLKRIGTYAFSGTKRLLSITIASKALKKKTVKGSLKKSSIKTVRVKAGKKALARYKKILKAKNSGKRVTVR